MISTKNLIYDLADVPREWAFEHYLNLTEKLTGQDIKMKSVFNIREKTPSMCIYIDRNNIYRFKDFSSGNGGDSIALVQSLFNLPTRGSASYKIIEDYNQYVLNNGHNTIKSYKQHSKFKVTDYEMRHWNTLDQKYWMGYHIGSRLLSRYNVVPLEYYVMTKTDENDVVSSITIKGNYIYGYFREDGNLYKIYQPKVKDSKFIKVRDYIQGTEQLVFDKPYLIITSSLKDLMAYQKLKISNSEVIAPDSENTMIPENIMNSISSKYHKVCVLFDNDEAGIKAAEKYKSRYGFEYVVLEMEKDLSDAIKVHGIDKVRENLLPLLKQALL
jgi:hypothetical protein